MAKKSREFEVDDMSVRLTKAQGGQGSLKLPNGITFWKPKKTGTHMVEIIPYHVTDAVKKFSDGVRSTSPGKWFYTTTYFTHRSIGVNNESYVCPARTCGKPCPICEDIQKLSRSPHADDVKRVKELKVSPRQLYLIYDLDDKAKGVQLWSVAHFNFGAQLEEYVKTARPKEQERFRKFYSPTQGMSVQITATEKPMPSGSNTVYSVRQFYDREQEIPDDLFDHGYDLDDMVRVLDYADLKAIYIGVSEDTDDENADDDDEVHVPTRTAKPSRPVDDDDEPPVKSKKKAQPADDDGDDEPPVKAKPASKPEPKSKKEPQLASGDWVSFEFRDEVLEGKIIKVDYDRAIVTIKNDERERPFTVDIPDVTLLKSDDTFDAKPSRPADDDDDEPPVKSKKKPQPADDDDENEAERSFRPKPGEDDEEEPPKPKSKSAKR